MTNSSQKTHFHVDERKRMGKKAKQLLSEGKVPGNIYGLGEESQAIRVPLVDFVRLYSEEGDTGLIFLSVGENKKEVPVLVDEVSYHPVTEQILHVVFRRVDLKQTIRTEIPVVVTGENKVPDSTVVLVTDAIEVEALPADLPEEFSINEELLKEIGQTITYAELDYDRSKVTIIFSGEETEESPVLILQEVKEEVEEAPAPVEGAEGEADTPAAPADTTGSEAVTE
ncbi:50S ribosomal protein L25 [Candidatus Woesebacteria bacterium]|nr:50S ribosomal protein L25 [Candidatus Woesebacteria bacterium]